MSEIKNNEAKQNEAPKKKEKKKSSGVLWILILLIVWWFNNFTLKTNSVSMKSSMVSSRLRFAVISDQHATKHGIKNKTIFEAIDKEKPDAVFFLGDMYTRESDSELMSKPVDLARKLTEAGYPVYAVTGEHDTDREYIDDLEAAGANVLEYESEYIDIKGNRVHLMGIDNVYYSPTFDLRNEFTQDADCFDILLAHIPNYEKFASFGADLTICADTHGDMVQIPFMGPLYDSETKTWLPKLSDKELEIYDKGFFDYDGGKMFITSGLGVYPGPFRFNNRPEVVILDVEPKR
ncbi:metallophosphoesterase [Ruminococcus flavefaciens]|uniref:Calcineurin-like phosphoesterase domain-containing protein n=1 Tax=Ruminococcus flavefaciens TaxID=1265 RepID=A0A1M7LVP8_RUMFL|nr:metallophosphoesterase [Ruminococcus flavefaciens]SHM82363.1 hypothetical protein SAMN04487860_11628 [Ruminococcus flavefaciens]